MTAWIILPISLSTFSIAGIWIVYAMAVMNHHVCPVENWSYNESCSADSTKHGYPKSCCTLEDVPLISKCGTYPPESCLFSLIGNIGAFLGGLCQISSLHRSWCCLPSWPAFHLPTVLPLLSHGCFCPGLLDGPFACFPLHHGLHRSCRQRRLLYPPELPPAAPGRHLRVGLCRRHSCFLWNLQLRVWCCLQRDPGCCPAAFQRPRLQVAGQQQQPLCPPELPPGEHCHDMRVAGGRAGPSHPLRCSGRLAFLWATFLYQDVFLKNTWLPSPSEKLRFPNIQRCPKDLFAHLRVRSPGSAFSAGSPAPFRKCLQAGRGLLHVSEYPRTQVPLATVVPYCHPIFF